MPRHGNRCPGFADVQHPNLHEAALTAAAPAAASSGWWNSFVFSDNFQGTPCTNALMGSLVNDTLRARG